MYNNCMYTYNYYVCMLRRPRVHHAHTRNVRACAYRNSVKTVNVDRMLTLIVAHQLNSIFSTALKIRCMPNYRMSIAVRVVPICRLLTIVRHTLLFFSNAHVHRDTAGPAPSEIYSFHPAARFMPEV